jgi:hypothetical protein
MQTSYLSAVFFIIIIPLFEPFFYRGCILIKSFTDVELVKRRERERRRRRRALIVGVLHAFCFISKLLGWTSILS